MNHLASEQATGLLHGSSHTLNKRTQTKREVEKEGEDDDGEGEEEEEADEQRLN